MEVCKLNLVFFLKAKLWEPPSKGELEFFGRFIRFVQIEWFYWHLFCNFYLYYIGFVFSNISRPGFRKIGDMEFQGPAYGDKGPYNSNFQSAKTAEQSHFFFFDMDGVALFRFCKSSFWLPLKPLPSISRS